jgi:hypothetical protein
MTAKDELKKLEKAEQELLARREQLTAAVAAATEARGAEILRAVSDGKEPAAPDSQVAGLQADLAAVSQALELLPRRRVDATRRAKAEEVQALRDSLPGLQARADTHEETTTRLLTELEAHEGVKYVHEHPAYLKLAKGEQLRDAVQKARTRADAIQRELDLEPKRAAEQAAREARFANAPEPGEAWRQAQAGLGVVMGGGAENDGLEADDDVLY